jgi:hypothetical protein
VVITQIYLKFAILNLIRFSKAFFNKIMHTYLEFLFFIVSHVLVLSFNLNFIKDYKVHVFIYCVANSHN